MTAKEEIHKLLKEKAGCFVDERLMPYLSITIWGRAKLLMSDLSSLNRGNSREVMKAFSALHDGLIRETIYKLTNLQHDQTN